MKKIAKTAGIISSLCVIAVGIIGGCASSSRAKNNSADTDICADWILSAMDLDGNSASPPRNASVTLFIALADAEELSVGGFSGVNSYSGAARAQGGVFSIQLQAATLMLGDAETEEFERSFIGALAQAQKYTLTDGAETLILSDSQDRRALTFKRFAINGSSWILSAYNSADGTVSSIDKSSAPTLNFGNDGSIFGFSGVNRFIGSYTHNARERALSFGSLGTTRMAAASEDDASLERAYLDLLERASLYRVSGGTLTLTDSRGRVLLVFESAR